MPSLHSKKLTVRADTFTQLSKSYADYMNYTSWQWVVYTIFFTRSGTGASPPGHPVSRPAYPARLSRLLRLTSRPEQEAGAQSIVLLKADDCDYTSNEHNTRRGAASL